MPRCTCLASDGALLCRPNVEKCEGWIDIIGGTRDEPCKGYSWGTMPTDPPGAAAHQLVYLDGKVQRCSVCYDLETQLGQPNAKCAGIGPDGEHEEGRFVCK